MPSIGLDPPAAAAPSAHDDSGREQHACPPPPAVAMCPFAALGAAAGLDPSSCPAAQHHHHHQQQQQPATVSPGVHQAWTLRRPRPSHDPQLTRRQLRALDRAWTLEQVAQHRYPDDAWVAVDGKVYDITQHVVDHPGWDSGCQVTTVLSILAHLGTDCSEEFRDIHRSYPVAWKQLKAFYIGDLAPPPPPQQQQQQQPRA